MPSPAVRGQGRGASSGAVRGVVREWHAEEGWGVVVARQTPGGCWVLFSHLAVRGLHELTPGQEVALEWEAAEQDGYAYRAVRVWPWGADPVAPTDGTTATATATAFRSTLRVGWGDPPGEVREPPPAEP